MSSEPQVVSAPASGRAAPLTGRHSEWLPRDAAEAIDRRSRLRAYGYFVGISLAFGGALALAVGPFGAFVGVAGAILAGLALSTFFVIAHDCVHNAFFPSRLENAIGGRIAYGLCWTSVTLWKQVHNINHHSRTNYAPVDDVWRPWSPSQYAKASAVERLLYRIFRGPMGSAVYYQLDFLFPKLILPLHPMARSAWRKHLPDSIFVIAFVATSIWVVFALAEFLAPGTPALRTAVLGVLIPFLIWNTLAAHTTYIQHTNPSIHWFDNEKRWSFYEGQIKSTADIRFALNVIPLYQNVLRHTAHHAHPMIPVYNLPRAQTFVLERYKQDVTELSLTFSNYFDVVRRCKLYDYDQQCWRYFDGRQSGPSWFGDVRNPFREMIGGAPAEPAREIA